MQVWWAIFQHISAQIIYNHNNEKVTKILIFHTVTAKKTSTNLLEIAFFEYNKIELIYKQC